LYTIDLIGIGNGRQVELFDQVEILAHEQLGMASGLSDVGKGQKAFPAKATKKAAGTPGCVHPADCNRSQIGISAFRALRP
jgi:hypothetical protein